MVTTDPTRRTFLGAAAALAALPATTAAAPTGDLAAPEDMEDAEVEIGEFTPEVVWASGSGSLGEWSLSNIAADQREIEVYYNDLARAGIQVQSWSGKDRARARAEMPPAQAKAVATALYQAADELEARMEARE